MVNYVQLLKNHPEHFRQFSCKEILFLNYDCPVKEKKAAVWSEFNYFYYVITGQKGISTKDQNIMLTKGTMSFIKRGACLKEQFFYEPFCVLVFILPDSFITRFIHQNLTFISRPRSSASDELVIPVDVDDMLLGFYQSIAPYFTGCQTPSEPLIEIKFTELLLHIVNNPKNASLTDYMHAIAQHKTGVLQKVMESNFNYNLELRDYANLCNRSVSSFKRDFIDYYKMPPGRWLLTRKLEYAKELLAKTEKDLVDVMIESGFENYSHFSKKFKAHFGQSPNVFRKKGTPSVVAMYSNNNACL